MAGKKNKVKFNISNVHYALLTEGADGRIGWGVPVPMPGAVSLSLEPQGEPESFYADGIEYYVINNNQGYDGDLEVAMIPESFRTDVLMEVTDANNVLVENASSETGKFALLFEFDGDVRKIRHVMYNCSASRPSIEAKTNEDGREVQTETLTIKARPLASGYVKAKTGDNTNASVYADWYKSVYQPDTSTKEEGGGDEQPDTPSTEEGGRGTDPEPDNPSTDEGNSGTGTEPETPSDGGENTETEDGGEDPENDPEGEGVG